MRLRNKKTGELVYAWSFYDSSESINLKYYTDEGQVNLEYKSLAELNEEWEDYKPKEPLIKDKKNRKLVRDWCKLYDYEPIRTYKRGDYISLYKDEVKGYSSSVGIDLPCDALQEVEDDHYYTIAELCGEE